jgi:hypothetical protein
MPRWLKYLSIAVAVLLGAFYLHTQQGKLAEARGAAKQALASAEHQKHRADSLEAIGQAHAGRADSVTRELKVANKKANVAIVAAPDTCDQYIAAVANARDLAVETADHWRVAFDAEKQAAAVLRGTLRDVGDASKQLVKQSKPSFLSRLTPDVGLGATAGVDPFTREPAVAVGVTLSWEIL